MKSKYKKRKSNIKYKNTLFLEENIGENHSFVISDGFCDLILVTIEGLINEISTKCLKFALQRSSLRK